jgi:hypothetical protein
MHIVYVRATSSAAFSRPATVTDLSSPDGMRIIFNMPKLLQTYF